MPIRPIHKKSRLRPTGGFMTNEETDEVLRDIFGDLYVDGLPPVPGEKISEDTLGFFRPLVRKQFSEQYDDLYAAIVNAMATESNAIAGEGVSDVQLQRLLASPKQPHVTASERDKDVSTNMFSASQRALENAIVTLANGNEPKLDTIFVEKLHELYSSRLPEYEGNRAERGRWRETSAASCGFDGANPSDISGLMVRLFDGWNGRNLPEVTLEDIASFHLDFLEIKPFAGGNGRVARLLTMWQLLACEMPFAIIRSENADRYRACLAEGDRQLAASKLAELLAEEQEWFRCAYVLPNVEP